MHKNRRVSLKSFLNKNVLSCDLKDTIELEHLISKGRLFHNFGAARKKNEHPKFSYKIILPALTETLFFSSIDSFFQLFPFLLRKNVKCWNFVSSNYHMT